VGFYRGLKKIARRNRNCALIGLFFLLASFLTLLFRVFFPYHRGLAAALLFIGGVVLSIPAFPLFHRLTLHRLAWSGIIIGIAFALYIMLVLFPISARVLVDEGLDEQIRLDSEMLVPLLAAIQDDPFINSPALDVSLANATSEDLEELEEGFTIFLDRMLLLENIITEYEGFYKVRKHDGDGLHETAFLIGYSAYLARYEAVLRLQEKVGSNEYVRELLDEDIPPFGKGNYRSLTMGLYRPETPIRINAGRAYLERIEGGGPLEDYSRAAYHRLFGSYKRSIIYAWKSLLISFEQGAMERWLPFQERVAKRLASTRVTSREGYLISHEQVKSLEKTLEPGDILFTRRNWHLSNSGMPGFWTHSAIYTGTLTELDAYFQEETESLYNSTFSGILLSKYPSVYHARAADPTLATIEGKAAGIAMYPLAVSADADSLAALRPDITKMQKLESLLFAFGKFGTAYDYDFDFSTEDSYVCSELVYKAYRDHLDFKPEMTAGRWMLAPNDMVRQAAMGDPGVSFVYFLDGDEEKDVAEPKGEEEFFQTWARPKHDLIIRYG